IRPVDCLTTPSFLQPIQLFIPHHNLHLEHMKMGTASTNFLNCRDPAMGERLLPRRELRALVPVSEMTIWRWERNGVFPRHLSINGRNYWRLSEVREWIARQKRADTGEVDDDH